MKRLLGSFLIMTALCATMVFGDIVGIGFGRDYKEAKKEALADLSQNISSVVESKFASNVEVAGEDVKKNASSEIVVRSHLPLLGVKIFKEKNANGGEIRVRAVLIKEDAIPLYKQKVNLLRKKLRTLDTKAKKTTDKTKRLKIFENLDTLLGEYERYKTVLSVLGVEAQELKIDRFYVQNELRKLFASIDSIEGAVDILARTFDQSDIFLYPPLLKNSSSVAEFGSVFLNHLGAKLHTTQNLKSAKYLLKGEYVVTKKGMVLQYRLFDPNDNSIVVAKTLTLAPKAYKNLQTKPKNLDFDMLLHSGMVLSNDLRVSLATNKGSSDLLFRNGEEIELLVKLNKMGYFYIVGYTQSGGKKLAYLLELNEGRGDEKFIGFVNADDANRWISLGKFSIEPPFGIESLQVFASNKPFKSLPHVHYNETSGYYEISNNVKKVVVKTRGLKKKKSKKQEFGEAVLTFTTTK